MSSLPRASWGRELERGGRGRRLASAGALVTAPGRPGLPPHPIPLPQNIDIQAIRDGNVFHVNVSGERVQEHGFAKDV